MKQKENIGKSSMKNIAQSFPSFSIQYEIIIIRQNISNRIIIILLLISIVLLLLQIKTMQQMTKNKLLYSKLQSSSSYIFAKMHKRKKTVLNPTQAESNPIYRALKGQKNSTSLLDLILGSVQKKQSNILAKLRSKSQFKDSINHKKSLLFRKGSSAQKLQQLKQRASKILTGTKKMAEELKRSKRRISILDRFNKRVDKYCSFLPQNPQEQQQNESNIANDQLVKLCKQTFFPTQNLHKRANSLMHYSQPIIPMIRLKKLKEQYKIIRTITSDTQPLKRKFKTEAQQ